MFALFPCSIILHSRTFYNKYVLNIYSGENVFGHIKVTRRNLSLFWFWQISNLVWRRKVWVPIRINFHFYCSLYFTVQNVSLFALSNSSRLEPTRWTRARENNKQLQVDLLTHFQTAVNYFIHFQKFQVKYDIIKTL